MFSLSYENSVVCMVKERTSLVTNVKRLIALCRSVPIKWLGYWKDDHLYRLGAALVGDTIYSRGSLSCDLERLYGGSTHFGNEVSARTRFKEIIDYHRMSYVSRARTKKRISHLVYLILDKYLIKIKFKNLIFKNIKFNSIRRKIHVQTCHTYIFNIQHRNTLNCQCSSFIP